MSVHCEGGFHFETSPPGDWRAVRAWSERHLELYALLREDASDPELDNARAHRCADGRRAVSVCDDERRGWLWAYEVGR